MYANTAALDAKEAEDLKQFGNDCYKNGNYEKAITYYTQAIELKPDAKMYYSNRVLTYLKLERYEEALKDCDKILMLDSEWKKGLHLRGLTLEHMKRLKEAKSVFERLLKQDPKHKVRNRLNRINKELGSEAGETIKTKETSLPATKKESKNESNPASPPTQRQLQSLKTLNSRLMSQLAEARSENKQLKNETAKKTKGQKK